MKFIFILKFSGAFQNTGLEAAITPAAISNKILLIASGTCASSNNTIAFRFTENDVATGIFNVEEHCFINSSFKCKSPRAITTTQQYFLHLYPISIT